MGRKAGVRTWAPLAMAAKVDLSTSTDWKEAKCKCKQEGGARAALRVPVHTPILRLAGEPKSQKRPLCGSQGSRSVHNSLSCLAHTRQQPQPSSTKLTPAGQRGAGPAGHWQLTHQ